MTSEPRSFFISTLPSRSSCQDFSKSVCPDGSWGNKKAGWEACGGDLDPEVAIPSLGSHRPLFCTSAVFSKPKKVYGAGGGMGCRALETSSVLGNLES